MLVLNVLIVFCCHDIARRLLSCRHNIETARVERKLSKVAVSQSWAFPTANWTVVVHQHGRRFCIFFYFQCNSVESFKYEEALSRQRSFSPIKETCSVDTSLIVPMAGKCSTMGNTLFTLRRLAKLSRVQTNTQDLSIKWNTKEASNLSPIVCFLRNTLAKHCLGFHSQMQLLSVCS